MSQPQLGWLVYQPLIVGLGAVVLGTIGNTLLEWFRIHRKNAATAQALRVALAEELRVERDTAETNSQRSAEVDGGESLIVPLREKYQIYDACLPDLGLLKPREVELVVYAYAVLNARLEALPLMSEVKRSASGVLMAIVANKYAHVMASNNRELHETLKRTVEELDRNSGKSKYPAKPSNAPQEIDR